MVEVAMLYLLFLQACYGVLSIPKGQWVCKVCAARETEPSCVLCPNTGGALKRVRLVDSGWRETHFVTAVRREGLTLLSVGEGEGLRGLHLTAVNRGGVVILSVSSRALKMDFSSPEFQLFHLTLYTSLNRTLGMKLRVSGLEGFTRQWGNLASIYYYVVATTLELQSVKSSNQSLFGFVRLLKLRVYLSSPLQARQQPVGSPQLCAVDPRG